MCVAASKLATPWHTNLENLSGCGPPSASPIRFLLPGLLPVSSAVRVPHLAQRQHQPPGRLLLGQALAAPVPRNRRGSGPGPGVRMQEPAVLVVLRPGRLSFSWSLIPRQHCPHGVSPLRMAGTSAQVTSRWPCIGLARSVPSGAEWQLLQPLCRPVVKFLGLLTN